MRIKDIALYLFLSLLLSLGVFRDAMWGKRILAPVDIAPDFFKQYRYMQPDADGIPDNHYVIDQLLYDLPIQYTIYHAYRHGEIPWWDPYTYAGRPLLADAHINGTDPLRLFCYFTMPFEAAYNWTAILKGTLSGLGLVLLLASLGLPRWLCFAMGFTFQFAGCFAWYFGHPWIQGSFVYYPFVWLAWASSTTLSRRIAYSAIPMAFIFYSGNIQSHAYAVIFGGLFVLATWRTEKQLAWQPLAMVAASGALGAMLAAPVLANQVEFFLLSSRTVVPTAFNLGQLLGGVLSLSFLYPWALGTFRGLDIGKLIEFSGAGFQLFIGTFCGVFAVIGACLRQKENSQPASFARVLSLFILATYFTIASTPLIQVLYTRISPMAVLALCVLSALGIASVIDNPISFRKSALAVAVIGTLLVVALQLGAFVIYPRLEGSIRKSVLGKKSDTLIAEAPALREFQISNTPHEISLLNPEALTGYLGLLTAAALLAFPSLRDRNPILFVMLAVNFVPVIFFYSRFVPSHEISLWNGLLSGGAKQETVSTLLAGCGGRFCDSSTNFEKVFPNALGHLQKVHTIHGYSALQPQSPFLKMSMAELQSFVDASSFPDDTIRQTHLGEGTRRFLLDGVSPAVIENESLNSIKIRIPNHSQILTRTETPYPGWTLKSPSGNIMKSQYILGFTVWNTSEAGVYLLKYTPRFFITGCAAAISALFAIFALMFVKAPPES